jgi:hypothetical protein
MTTRFLPPRAASVSALLCASLALLAACSPHYNWRDYTSPDGHYRITFPAKPASAARDIDLDGMRVRMQMTAAEIDGATFAVGAAEAPDAARARAALDAMKRALLRNIGAATANATASASASAGADSRTAIEVDASGSVRGAPTHLRGHFEARGTRFYQVIVLARDQPVPPEQIEQFLTSFSLP